MLPGRKPIPAHLQVVTDTKSRSKFSQGPSTNAPKIRRRLRIPSDLTPPQKIIWQGIAKHALPGQLEQADGELMRMLVIHISLAREYELKLRSSPALVRTPNGMAVQTPYLAMLNRQTAIILKLLTSLGFTPTERARLNIGSSNVFDDCECDEFD